MMNDVYIICMYMLLLGSRGCACRILAVAYRAARAHNDGASDNSINNNKNNRKNAFKYRSRLAVVSAGPRVPFTLPYAHVVMQ